LELRCTDTILDLIHVYYPSVLGKRGGRGMPPIDKFVHEENIRRLREGIARETDPDRAAVLKKLLEEEMGRDLKATRASLPVPPEEPPEPKK